MSDVITSTSDKPILTRKQWKDLLRGPGKHSMQQVRKVLARNKGNHGAVAKTLEFFGLRPAGA